MITSLFRTIALLALVGLAVACTALAASGPSSIGTAAQAQYGGNTPPPVAPGGGTTTTTPPGQAPAPGTNTGASPTPTPDQNEVEDNNDSGGNNPGSGTDDNNNSGNNGSGTDTNTETGSTPSATVSSGDLPFTGWAVLPIVLIGLVALLSGIALRRRSDGPHSA